MVSNVCQRIGEITAELDVVAKAKHSGKVVVQLQQDNNILNALVYFDTVPEQISQWNGAIEDIVSQFE